jgi:hypothetical protein
LIGVAVQKKKNDFTIRRPGAFGLCRYVPITLASVPFLDFGSNQTLHNIRKVDSHTTGMRCG